MKNIFSELKLQAVENNCIVNDFYQRYQLYKIQGLDCYFKAQNLLPLVVAANRELDTEGTTVELFSLCTKSDPVADALSNDPDFMKHTRADFLKKTGLRSISKYLSITTDPRSNKPHTAPIKEDAHRNFLDIAGCSFTRLDTSAIQNFLYHIINIDDDFRTVSSMSTKQALLQSQIRYTPEYMQVGNKYLKVLTCNHLPDEIEFFALDPILDNLECEYLAVSAYTVLNQKTATGALTIMRNVSQTANEQVDEQGRVIRKPVNHDAKQQYEQAEQLKEHIAKTNNLIVLTTQKIILWDTDPAHLEETAATVINTLKKRMFFFFEEEYFHDIEFFRSLPGCTIFSERGNKLLTENALALLPLSHITKGDAEEEFPLQLRTRQGFLYGYDTFSSRRMPWNIMVLGATGSGKSMFMNELLIHCVVPRIKKYGGITMVFDFAGAENSSYLKIVKLYNGKFIAVDSSGRFAINPFPKRELFLASGDPDPAQLTFLQIVVDMIIGNAGEDPTANLKRFIISKAIRAMYQDYAAPRLQNLVSYIGVVEGDEHLKVEISKLLRGFLDSPESKLINSETTIEYTGSQFVVIDLQGINTLTDRLRQLMVFIFMQEARNVAFRSSGWKTLIFDEVAQLIKDPRMVSLIDELYATVRKYNAQIFTITQNYASYKECGLSSKIKLNTTTSIVLSHADAPEAKRLVAQDFDFSEYERAEFEQLKTIKRKYSLALIKTQAGDKTESATVKLELSPIEYWLATSDKSDNEKLEKIAREKGCSIIKACYYAATEP